MTENNTHQSAILLVSCPDREGLVAAVTNFIAANNGNILHLDQHVDQQENVFFMRVEWDLSRFSIQQEGIGAAFQPIANEFSMTWEIQFSDHVPRMAIFVSKQDHCLYDLLSRVQSTEWRVDVPIIISNHPDLQHIGGKFGIEYRVFPINKANKREQEDKQIALLNDLNVDFIVLARYMQILTSDFVNAFPNRIINIHHSFLPAFAGAKPYHAAYARGVKIIGATSHYVTAELDAGPIIEQDVARVSHKASLQDLIRLGKDTEKIVLSRAVWHHLNRQVLVYNNKTVVFG